MANTIWRYWPFITFAVGCAITAITMAERTLRYKAERDLARAEYDELAGVFRAEARQRHPSARLRSVSPDPEPRFNLVDPA